MVGDRVHIGTLAGLRTQQLANEGCSVAADLVRDDIFVAADLRISVFQGGGLERGAANQQGVTESQRRVRRVKSINQTYQSFEVLRKIGFG